MPLRGRRSAAARTVTGTCSSPPGAIVIEPGNDDLDAARLDCGRTSIGPGPGPAACVGPASSSDLEAVPWRDVQVGVGERHRIGEELGVVRGTTLLTRIPP